MARQAMSGMAAAMARSPPTMMRRPCPVRSASQPPNGTLSISGQAAKLETIAALATATPFAASSTGTKLTTMM